MSVWVFAVYVPEVHIFPALVGPKGERRRQLNINIVGKEPTIGEEKTFELVPELMNKHHVDRRRDDKAVDGERHKRDTLDQLQEGLDGD